MARPKMMKERVALFTYVDGVIANQLQVISSESGAPVAAIIRQAIEQYLAQRSHGSVPPQMP